MEKKLGIIGLGYVGLPLAVTMAKKYNTLGFDINKKRIDEFDKALNWFRVNNPEAYYVLLD